MYNLPAPEVDRIVTLLARDPERLRIYNAPEDCKACDRRTGRTCRGGFVTAFGLTSSSLDSILSWMSRTGTATSSSFWTAWRTWTFLRGDDCKGEPIEEKESFRFRVGVRVKSGASGLCSTALDVLVKAGPRRLTAGELRAFKAWRLVLTELALFPPSSMERGVKNRLKDRGVTGGGFLGLRR